MKFEIENTSKENLTIINAIINHLARYEVQTLRDVDNMLYRIFLKSSFYKIISGAKVEATYGYHKKMTAKE